MQVRVFTCLDMASGLKQVREELGPDALILSTRTVRNGKLGLLDTPTIEITATIDIPLSGKQEKAAPANSLPQPTLPRSSNTPASPAPPDGKDKALESRQTVQAGNIKQALPDHLNLTQQHLESATRLLEESGIDEATSKKVANLTAERLSSAEIVDNSKLRSFLSRTIESLVQVEPPHFEQQPKPPGQSRIALLGPTGVGKTTTLAKLAAHYHSNHSLSIALVTIDTYRFAAVEQLKAYAEIMKLPVDVVISPAHLQESLHYHRDKDLVLIDTAGRSPRDSLFIQELVAFFQPHLGIEKHLVLSAATRESELLETIRHFEVTGIDRTIYTKIDECKQAGAILNVQLQNKAPLSYITNGQRVPEDLLQITSRSVAELFLSYH